MPRMVNIRVSISDLIRFCSMKQTYFCKRGKSRNGYAGLCVGTTLFELRCLNFVVRTSLLELRCLNYVFSPDSYQDS